MWSCLSSVRPRDDKTKQTEVKLPFLAGPSAKRQSTPGDYYGAFGPKLPGMYSHFYWDDKKRKR